MTFVFKPGKFSADLSGTWEEEPPRGIPRFSYSWGRGQAAAWTQPRHTEPLTVSQACGPGPGVPLSQMAGCPAVGGVPSSVHVSPTPGPKERTGGLRPGSACPALAHTRHSSCCSAAKPPLCRHGNASCEGQGGWRSSPELVWAEGTSSSGKTPPSPTRAPPQSRCQPPDLPLSVPGVLWLLLPRPASPSLPIPGHPLTTAATFPGMAVASGPQPPPLPSPWGPGTVKGL